MCGIAGFIGNGSYETGLKMIRSIKYRGPDYQAVVLRENVCIAHARLSIIDLSPEANQPMFNTENTACIIFNGEIYNYKELKDSLLKKNKYHFRTNSDTEVLLYLYAEYGNTMLKMLNGMFAFAIYDFTKEELFLAKDRMGKKPLYYCTAPDGTFVFGSELKAVLAHPSVSREINMEALNQYLTFDYVPTPNTIIRNVFKLKPGTFLLIKEKKITEQTSYWSHNFNTDYTISFKDAVNQLDILLNAATTKRLMSDVPLGVFLSGGLDSSTIAYYAQKNAAVQINTFSIGFEDASYDEQAHSQQVAKYLGTQHHSSLLTQKKTLDLIHEIYPLVDEPFADPSLIPTYYLSKFTREIATVALGGDGSDELLTGYPTFISNKFKFPLQYFPKPLIHTLLRLAELFPASDKNISFDFKLKQYLRGFLSSSNHIHQLWLGSFSPAEKKSLFTPDAYSQLKDKDGLGIIDSIFNSFHSQDDLTKIVHYYYLTYLADNILVKVDRASMYSSLEVRAPFLDKEVVEFVNILPHSFKLKGLTVKYILKKLMSGKLPQNIIDRPKKGFGIPLSSWIRTDLKHEILNVLTSKDDLFSPIFVQKIVYEHLSKKRNHRKLIWNLYVFKLWQKQYFPG